MNRKMPKFSTAILSDDLIEKINASFERKKKKPTCKLLGVKIIEKNFLPKDTAILMNDANDIVAIIKGWRNILRSAKAVCEFLYV